MITELLSRRLRRVREFEEGTCLTLFTKPDYEWGEEGPSEEAQKVLNEVYQAIEQHIPEEEKQQQYKEKITNMFQDCLASKKKYISVAHFLSNALEIYFHVPLELPYKIVIDKRFYLEPVLFALNRTTHYIVVVLSDKNTRFFEGVNETLIEYQPRNAPKAFKDVVSEFDLKQILNPPDIPMSEEDRKMMERSIAIQLEGVLIKFLKKLDDSLCRILEREPLRMVVVGTEQQIRHYKEITRMRDRIAAFVMGLYEYAPAEEVAEFVLPVLQDALRAEEQMVHYELESADMAGMLEKDPEKIWQLLQEEKVQRLFLNKEATLTAEVSDEQFSINGKGTFLATDWLALKASEQGCFFHWLPASVLEPYGTIAAAIPKTE